MTLFLGINLVITPPTVSIPRVRGATSNRSISGGSKLDQDITVSELGIPSIRTPISVVLMA